jgi:hypothetical protein
MSPPDSDDDQRRDAERRDGENDVGQLVEGLGRQSGLLLSRIITRVRRKSKRSLMFSVKKFSQAAGGVAKRRQIPGLQRRVGRVTRLTRRRRAGIFEKTGMLRMFAPG